MTIIENNVTTGEQIEKELTAEELAEIEQNKPIAPEITQVTMRQARLALLKSGLLDIIENQMTTPEQKIWWDYSIAVEKYNPIMQAIKVSSGWSDEYLTQLFDLASTL